MTGNLYGKSKRDQPGPSAPQDECTDNTSSKELENRQNADPGQKPILFSYPQFNREVSWQRLTSCSSGSSTAPPKPAPPSSLPQNTDLNLTPAASFPRRGTKEAEKTILVRPGSRQGAVQVTIARTTKNPTHHWNQTFPIMLMTRHRRRPDPPQLSLNNAAQSPDSPGETRSSNADASSAGTSLNSSSEYPRRTPQCSTAISAAVNAFPKA